ncbi:MAG: RNA methyltransferase [Kiritimatiellae bacterium]|nr:RNA methyltransferase [Kiritimatiellia bacterium]
MRQLDPIRIVCVNTLYGGNIGSICRAMQNCGLHHLRLVNPNPDLDPVELRKMALKAITVYDNRQEYPTLAEAVADCGAVAVTSGIDGFHRDQAKGPRDWAPELLEAARHKPVAIVFGAEDKGLCNDDLKLGTHWIRIPSHPDYSSLNLSQAVLLCAHELFLASGEFEPREESSPPANHEFRERMFDAWEETMLGTGFCKEDKLDHMMMGLRRVLSRGAFTENDVKIMLGLARQCQWAAKNQPDSTFSDPRNRKKTGFRASESP